MLVILPMQMEQTFQKSFSLKQIIVGDCTDFENIFLKQRIRLFNPCGILVFEVFNNGQ